MKTNCVLSLILCSRNDNFQGNSLWRLQTTLNYLAESYIALNRKYQIEVLVVDWGSEIPLRKDLLLLKEAAEITRFIEISPQFAKKHQADSPFAEVLALNIAVRRAKGEYIGRIDQDTLVTTSFFRIFFSLYNATIKTAFSLDNSFFFCRKAWNPI